jgi:hypothetical protein
MRDQEGIKYEVTERGLGRNHSITDGYRGKLSGRENKVNEAIICNCDAL